MVKFIHSVAHEMGIRPETVRVLLQKDQFHFGPSIIEAKHIPGWAVTHQQALLVVPMGFLKLYRSDKRIARALLAHEMAHLLSEDTIRWHQTRSYHEASWLLITTIVVGMVTSCFWEIDVVLPPSGSPSPSPNWFAPMASALVYAAITLMFVWSHFNFIRSCRRFSEITADCCAAAYSGVPVMRSALEYCQTNSNPAAHSIGYHPPLSYRIDRLNQGYRDQPGTAGRVFALCVLGLGLAVLGYLALSGSAQNLWPGPAIITLGICVGVFLIGWYRDWLARE